MHWAFGYDHAGFRLALDLDRYLTQHGHTVEHYGPTDEATPSDYVAFCIAAATAVASQRADFAIVIGGSGQGEQIAANKVRHIRAALCPSPDFARLARQHNDANVLALPARVIALDFAKQIVDVWIDTAFEGERHARRIGQIEQYEQGALDVSGVAAHPRPEA